MYRYCVWLMTCPVLLIHLSNLTGLNEEYSPVTMRLLINNQVRKKEFFPTYPSTHPYIVYRYAPFRSELYSPSSTWHHIQSMPWYYLFFPSSWQATILFGFSATLCKGQLKVFFFLLGMLFGGLMYKDAYEVRARSRWSIHWLSRRLGKINKISRESFFFILLECILRPPLSTGLCRVTSRRTQSAQKLDHCYGYHILLLMGYLSDTLHFRPRGVQALVPSSRQWYDGSCRSHFQKPLGIHGMETPPHALPLHRRIWQSTYSKIGTGASARLDRPVLQRRTGGCGFSFDIKGWANFLIPAVDVYV